MAIELRKVKIGDASTLRFMNLMSGTLSQIESEIRSFNNSPSIEVLVVTRDGLEVAMTKVLLMDRKKARVHLEYVFTDGETYSENDYKDLINETLRFCFIERLFHKVTITISSKNLFLEPVVSQCGFIQEAVLRDEIRVGSSFEDAGLFSILSSEYKAYNVCFVPFTLGVVAISGGMDYIDGAQIYHYGDVLEGDFLRNVAGSMGIIDDEYRLIDDEDLYEMDEEQLEYLPVELSKAFTEVKEFLTKKREIFDLNFIFPNATEFQRKVWSIIRKIPYGGTLSYEEIALKMTDNDITEARKISRAVGNACGENPILIMIPCHRVISKDSKLTGYQAGLDVKDHLLMLESFSIIGGRRNG